VVGVRLRPGRGAELLRTSARELRDRVARLDDLFPAEARAASGEADPAEPAAMAERLERILLSLRRRAPEPDRLVAEAVRLIERRRGALTVASVARWLGTTPRQLERRFRDGVGLSPKRWCRIARLDHAMNLLASGATAPLVEVAGAAGYHDQAHLTREFRELAGVTPGGFVRARAGCDQDAGSRVAFVQYG
jgi:transcriptional regulator GlxA family with amidase domain